jgi:dipeptidyl aminopeptidase/acylaminoacyl peptidase
VMTILYPFTACLTWVWRAIRRRNHTYLSGCVLCVVTLVASTCGASATSPKNISPKDLLRVATVKSILISPDGTRLLAEVVHKDSEENRENKEWLVISLIPHGNMVQVPEQWNEILENRSIWWGQDSGDIEFISPTKGLTYWSRLNLGSFTAGRVSDLPLSSENRSVSNPLLSPDGEYLAYLVSKSSPAANSEVEKDVTPLDGVEADINWIYGSDMPDPEKDHANVERSSGNSSQLSSFEPKELWIMDVKSGIKKRISEVGKDVISYAWTGNQEVWCLSQSSLGGVKYLLSIDVTNNASKPKGQYPGAVPEIAASADLTRVSLLSDGKLIVRDVHNGSSTFAFDPTHRPLTRDFSFLSTPRIWSVDGKRILLFMQGQMTRSFFELNVDSGDVRAIGRADKMYSHVAYDPHAGTFAAVREDYGEPPAVYVFSRATWESRMGFDPNEDLRALPWPTTTEVRWRSKDNKFTIHGLLLMPSDYSDNERLPLVVENNGGPGVVNRTFNGTAGYPAAGLAANGYLVLNVNSRGRPGYGQDFRMALHDEKSLYEHPLEDDIIPGIDYLVRKGIAEPRRVGMMGSSYGGALTAWAVCRTTRFRAVSIGEGVPLDAVDAMFPVMGNPIMRTYLTGQLGMQVPYSRADRQIAERDNPFSHVEDVRTPSMYEGGILSEAARDGRSWYQAMQFFHIPSELIAYPRSGHGWTEPALILDSYRRNMDWFNYWLRDQPYSDESRQKAYDSWKAKRAALGDPRWSDNVK